MPPPSTVEISQGSRQGARSNLTPQQIMDQAYKLALQKGLGEDGARVVLAILQTEGGLTGLRGDLDIGGSAGPLQFYVKGQLPNYASARKLSMDQAMVKAETDPLDAIGWALDTYLGNAIRAGQKAGLQGPQLATYAQAKGQVSKTPERAGANYSAMFSGQAAAQPAAGGRMAEPTTTTTSSSTATAEESAYLKRLREQKAQAEAAVRSAQLRRAALAQELAPRLQDGKIAEADYKAALAPVDAEIADARKQLTYVQDRIDDYEYQLDTERRKADAGSKPQTPEDAARTRLYEAQATKAERGNDPARLALDDTADALKQYKDLLDLQITQGDLSDRDADKAWAKALALGAAGVSAEQKRHDLMRLMAPQMGDRQLAQAAVTQLQGWRQHGANVPDFELPVFTMDPAADYAKWLPDPSNVQSLWQRAMAEGPGRKQQDDDMVASVEERLRQFMQQQGAQGWDGAMATGGATGGSAAPLSDPTLGVHDYPPGPQRTGAAGLPTSGGGVQDDYTSSFDWTDPRMQDMTDQPRQRQQTAGRAAAGSWDMRTGWPTPPMLGPQRPPARAAAPTAEEEWMEVDRVLDENPSLSLEEAQEEARIRLQSRRQR